MTSTRATRRSCSESTQHCFRRWSLFVRNKRQLLKVYQQAQTFSQKPSDILGIPALCEEVLGGVSSWICWQVDSAAAWWGMTFEGKMLERTKSGKNRYDAETLLRSKAENTAASLKKAMKRGYVEDRTKR